MSDQVTNKSAVADQTPVGVIEMPLASSTSASDNEVIGPFDRLKEEPCRVRHLDFGHQGFHQQATRASDLGQRIAE